MATVVVQLSVPAANRQHTKVSVRQCLQAEFAKIEKVSMLGSGHKLHVFWMVFRVSVFRYDLVHLKNMISPSNAAGCYFVGG